MDPAFVTGEPNRLFVRFQSAAPNRHGRYPGVFALVNGLSWSGRLTDQQEQFRQRQNAWYQANLIDPAQAHPSIYDRRRHPGATAWFKASATQLIAGVSGYLAILDAHGTGWVRLDSNSLGQIIYNDQHQVIAMPADP
ncbi:hypothetical protein [Nocardia sp. NBC_00403]|uniref:hypothetical protein n=1 Tax=Nocardia sp. NBC_00403 TaxID=2975990 RepID=UPI002E214CE8